LESIFKVMTKLTENKEIKVIFGLFWDKGLVRKKSKTDVFKNANSRRFLQMIGAPWEKEEVFYRQDTEDEQKCIGFDITFESLTDLFFKEIVDLTRRGRREKEVL
jgi:hypothetical protein